MKTKFLGPLVVAAVLVLAGSSATPASADNPAPTYHQIALITVPGAPLMSTTGDFSAYAQPMALARLKAPTA